MIRILFFYKMLLLQRKMGPKKGCRVRKIEVPIETPPEFELGDTVADVQQRREEREAREREEEAQKQREEARREETTHSAEGGVAEKRARTARSDTEMDREAGGEVGTSHLHSRLKKGHMTNICLTNSDEEAFVDFIKDPEELYDKTDEHFNDKARKEYIWERFTNSRNLSVKVCKS